MPDLSPSNSSASIAAAVAPLFDHFNTTWPGEFFKFQNGQDWPDFNAWWQGNNGPKDAGSDIIIGSWLVGERHLNNVTQVEEAFKAFTPPNEGATAYLVGGGAVANVVPRGGSDALLPAWRTALLHCSRYPCAVNTMLEY